jgi:hypothetical protein
MFEIVKSLEINSPLEIGDVMVLGRKIGARTSDALKIDQIFNSCKRELEKVRLGNFR